MIIPGDTLNNGSPADDKGNTKKLRKETLEPDKR